MTEPEATTGELVVGRYFLFREIAAGGMASIHLARLVGPVGFGRNVAVKRLHPHYAREKDFVAMFVDEARIVTSIRHPNVVPVLDVVSTPGNLLLVMEYVHGASLSTLFANGAVPPAIASAIVIAVLEGLHAAHEARGPGGTPLDVIHRDVSPQNVIVGQDGMARVLDFGIAKAATQLHESTTGTGAKGKLKYMAPEQLDGRRVDRRVDLWAAGVVLWELVTGQRLFKGDNEGAILLQVLEKPIPLPSAVGAPATFDDVTARALTRTPDARFADARTMALAVEAACRPASTREVAAWVESIASPILRERERLLEELEHVVQAGMPSVRTQLAYIADAARPSAPPSVPPSPDSTIDATAVVGGRPAATRAASDPPPPRRSRVAIGALVVAGVLGLSVGAGALAAKRSAPAKAAGPPPSLPLPPPEVATSAAPSASVVPSAVPGAAASPSAVPAAAASSAPPPRRPFKRPDDGVRLDHRK